MENEFYTILENQKTNTVSICVLDRGTLVEVDRFDCVDDEQRQVVNNSFMKAFCAVGVRFDCETIK